MTNKMINSIQTSAAVGPYSHSALVENALYISEQLGLDPQSGEMRVTMEEQAKQAFINLDPILKEVGTTYNNIVKTTMFLQHMPGFSKVNEIYRNYLSEVLPARSCVEVVRLSKDGLFEIEAVAVKR